MMSACCIEVVVVVVVVVVDVVVARRRRDRLRIVTGQSWYWDKVGERKDQVAGTRLADIARGIVVHGTEGRVQAR